MIAGNNYANAHSGGGGNDSPNDGGGDRLEKGEADRTAEDGAGNDTLVFRPDLGKNFVENYANASNNHDVLEFSGSLLAAASAEQAATTQQGADAIIAIDAWNQITLKGMSMAALETGDFRFC